MINFEEELKRFKPSPEVADAESAITKRDLTDVADIISELMRRQQEPLQTKPQSKAQASQPVVQPVMNPEI